MAEATATLSIVRGPETWNFIYICLGFALTIEGTVVAMIEPIHYPRNIVLFAVVAAATFYLFICNGTFQNKLVELKNSYEHQAR